MSKKLLYMCMMAIMMVVSMSAYALDKKDGVYQIGSAQDFLDFAALVNGGDTYACAELTADIDLGTDGTMIGSDANRFRGIFDGKGHSITVNSFPESDGQAIFRNIEGNALVQNLKVQGTITTNKKEAAGIAAWGRGTIRNCWIDLTVVSGVAGDGTHAGIVAVASEGLVIENCLSKITVNGASTTNCGGITGWADGNITIANCLVINDGTLSTPSDCGTISRNPSKMTVVDLDQYNGGEGDGYNWRPRGANYNNYAVKAWGNTDKVSIISVDDLTSGKICYQLNNDQSTIAWVQDLDKDRGYPVPAVFGGKQVFASGPTGCNGLSSEALSYSNSGTVQATPHTTDKFGICTTCGHMVFEALPRDMSDNSYIAKTAEDLDWLEGRNRVNNGGWFNISLANDIEYIAVPGQLIFNNDNWFGGNFDGHGHALTIEFTEAPSAASLFPNFRGTLKNTIFHGSISTSEQYAGTVTGHTRDNKVVIQNVFSDVNIYPTRAGDNTIGGLIGVGDTNYRLENSIYAGTIEGTDATECLAGICGWSAGNGTMVNVAFLGNVVNGQGDSQLMSRNPSKVIPTNGYYLNDCGYSDDRFTQVDADDVESGRLAFLLNGQKQGGEDFYQVIGTDMMPMPIAKEGGKVYAAASSYRCDGVPEGNVEYSNTQKDVTIPPHSFTGGFCDVCGTIDADYVTPAEDGWFELGTADELIWWSHYAAQVNLGACVRLTADIDMDDKTSNMPYAIVGNETTPFYGSFDGQFHTISNFNVSYPNQRGVGLIAVMNSRASKGDGMSDADARNAEGVFIKNVVLDKSCEIEGLGYCGIVGMTAEWAGHVTFLNVGMDGHVMCTTGANAGGVLGCVMGSTCHITIDNCYMTGDCDGPLENGSFSGWLGDHCDIKNCYAIGTVTGAEGEDTHKYFARYGNATITNCYTLKGGTIDDANHQVYRIEEADIASGKFTYLLNGKQFRTSLFYQDLEEDDHPVANPAHGTIVYAAGEYMTVNEETMTEVVETIADFYNKKAEDTHAYVGAIEAMQEKIEELNAVSDILSLADALDTIYVYEAAVDASAAIYKKYKDKVAETLAYLADHDDFEGEDRDELQDYLEGEAEEIYEDRELPDSLIEKEILRIEEWLALAIYNGYMPGTDVTRMLINPNFSDGKDRGWEGEKMATGHATVEREKENLYGIESWSDAPFAMTQTVKGMKPGYYLVGVDGAYRPQNNRYSYNYAAQISANGNVNFLQTVIEDKINAADAIDGENANITGPTPDLGVSDDGITTEFDETTPADGYVVHGPYGLAIAASADRYNNFIACEVGEDSVLTIGIANPHSNVGTYEWTGAANVTLEFLGGNEDAKAEEGLAEALESQLARANTILNLYVISEYYSSVTACEAPNYPSEVRDALEAAVAEAESAASAEEKMASIQKLSQLFQDIYAGKQAYLKIINSALAAENVLSMIDESLIPDYDAIQDGVEQIYLEYEDGSISLKDALNFNIAKRIPALAKIVAPQDENGTYQISEPLHLIFFGAAVSNGGQKSNAVLTKDINMDGITFSPIASGTRYNGVFDGQGYAITNLVVGDSTYYDAPEKAGLFSDIENATVKNLKIQSTIYTTSKFAAGITGYTRNARIQDCDVDVTVHSLVEGDGTHGGIAGVNEVEGTVVENCKVHFVLDGENTTCWGGIFGWSTNGDQVKNTLIIAEILAADMEGSNSVSRNDGNCSCSNVYFTTKLNGSGIGTFIEATDSRFKTGELAWLLNGSQADDVHWFQTLGKDDMPHLFGGSIVWKFGEEFFNSRPNIQLNAFASNLSTATNSDQVIVAYTLNAQAKSAAINFYAGNELKYSHVLKGGDLMAGGHEVAVDNSLLGVAAGTKMTYVLDVTAMGITEPTKIGEGYQVNSPYGLAINNVPASKGFGQIYIAESRPLEKGEGSICEQKPGALFAFDANFQPINAKDGTPGFYGGLNIKDNKEILTISGDYQFDLKNLRVSKDGRLFIARASGNSTSSVWEADPADLNKPWTPIFTGGELDAATGIVTVGGEEQNRPAVALAVEGEGENLKLTILGAQRSDGEQNFSDYKCFTYNLGTATAWSGAPSSVYEPLTGKYTIAPAHVGIVADNRGGLWYEQYPSTVSEETPALKHFDVTGMEDFSDKSTSTCGEAIAISDDGTILAIPMGANKVVIYETNYAPMANGMIFLDAKYNISTTESQVTGMAFDYANNLYITSSASKTLNRYAVPSFTENKSVTPAAEGFTVGAESGDPDAIENVKVNVNNGAIYNIAGQRVSKAQKGIFVVDGQKVATK